jgi:uncharacterized lipoprotein YajG
MGKLVFFFLTTTMMAACAPVQTTQEVVLPNGKTGITIDCTMQGWPVCFKSAGDRCKQGYVIYERTQDEEVRSEIPISKLEDEKSLAMMKPVPVQPAPDVVQNKERYMVIACK